MTATFTKVSAGIYEVQTNSNTVGFIRKASASKWIVADVVDHPLGVYKTLKEAKNAVECNYVKFDVEEVDNTSKDDYNHSVPFEDEAVDNTLELQRQMLASMKTYQVNTDGNFVEVKKEPTLELIEF